MDIRVLQYFLAVAREQSISKAANSLHLSQPTLSVQLKALEDEIGKKLLIRGAKGSKKVTLTDEGILLRQRAEEILNLVDKTKKELTFNDQFIMGDVYIASGETIAIKLLADTAQELAKKYPDIHYHLSSGNAEFVFEQIEKGLIDFGLVFDDIDPQKYHSLALPYKDIWGILLPKGAPLANKTSITFKDLKDIPLLMPQQEQHAHNFITMLNQNNDDLNIIGTYNLLYNASKFVEAGFGYALGIDNIINNDALTFVPFEPKIVSNIHIIWKKYQIFSKPAEKFIQTFIEMYQLNHQ